MNKVLDIIFNNCFYSFFLGILTGMGGLFFGRALAKIAVYICVEQERRRRK